MTIEPILILRSYRALPLSDQDHAAELLFAPNLQVTEVDTGLDAVSGAIGPIPEHAMLPRLRDQADEQAPDCTACHVEDFEGDRARIRNLVDDRRRRIEGVRVVPDPQ